MSKFFAANSDSESSSSESESDNEPAGFNAPNFMFSDDEEDTKRVVRSAKDKRYEQLNGIIKNIRNSKKIKDFNKMESSFMELGKAYDKARPVVAKEESGTPRFFVRILVEMEDLVNETWEDRDYRKSMSKNNAKSLSSLRQKLRKYIRNEFNEDVEKFRQNPDQEDEPEESDKGSDDDASDDDDADDFKKPSAKDSAAADMFKKKALDEDDDDSDSEDWDDDESSSESSDDGEGRTAIDIFKKKDGDDTKVLKKKQRDKGDKEKRALRKKDRDLDDEDGTWTTVDRGAVEKPKMFDKDAEINHQLVIKKLQEIVSARGKKRTDRKEQIELLTELNKISGENNLGLGIELKIKFAIVAAIFDYNPKISEAMKPEHWEQCMPAVKELLTMIKDNLETVVAGDNIGEDMEQFEEAPYKVRGCFLSVVERLDEEFVKVLKGCDAHSHEYVDRLKDEPKVMEVLEMAQDLVDKLGSPSEMCRIYLKRIEHIYFKFDTRVIQKKKGELSAKEETSVDAMDRLCKYVYAKDSTDRLRTRAILCHIYHHAIHDMWFEARDLMLMSHLQDTITHSDPLTQILYNRTMVQLGLCGFRKGEIRDAHNALLDIQLGGRSKELLAQGLLPQRHNERSSDQEKIEKQRQMPFHMHINLEMLECVYLVSAMLLEIPYMAAHEFDARRRMISKSYYQQLRSSERQALVGPPESMREHIVAASKAMRNGNWVACKNTIINDKMNAKVWDLFYEADKVREMLAKKIQEETMRTYLFTYSKVYDSISVVTLSDMFSLEKEAVHAVVSKMIINEELMASLDEPSECMVMHRTEPSRLQSLSLQLSDKIAQLVDNNERLLELRPGQWQGQWRNKQDGGDRRDGGGGNFRGGHRGEGGQNRDNYRGGHRDGGGNYRGGHRDGGNYRGGHRDGGGGNYRGGHRDGGGNFRRDNKFGGDRNKFGGDRTYERNDNRGGNRNWNNQKNSRGE